MPKRFFTMESMAVVCVVIAGVVEAAQQALSQAPKVTAKLPDFFTSPNWNYVPLGLVIVAGGLWVWNQLWPRQAPKETGSLVPIQKDEERDREIAGLKSVIARLERELANFMPYDEWLARETKLISGEGREYNGPQPVPLDGKRYERFIFSPGTRFKFEATYGRGTCGELIDCDLPGGEPELDYALSALMRTIAYLKGNARMKRDARLLL